MSEFSHMTDESEIAPQENILDLRLQTAILDKTQLSNHLNSANVSAQGVNTFFTVEFYNHDFKTTDLCQGFDPQINTVFSFRNVVDNFYMKHLEKDCLLIEVFLTDTKPQTKDSKAVSAGAGSTRRVGSARLPLHKLIEKDVDFQAQEIVDMTERGPITVGRIFYQVRMRKPLDEALRWYQQSKALESGKLIGKTSS